MKFIQQIIKPPVFDDDEKTHQAYLLNIILWALIFVPPSYFLFMLLTQPELAVRALVQAIFGEVANVFLLILLKRGYVRPASLIQTFAFWIFFTATAFTSHGVQDEGYLFGYPLVILIAGLLLGTRTAIGFTVLCLLSGLSMVYLQNIGILNVPENRSTLTTWVLSLIIFPIMTTLQYLTWRTVNNALTRARRSEEKYMLISRVSSDYAFESRITKEGVAETIWIGGAFEKMTGYTPEEYFAAGGWYAHVHPDDLEQDDLDMKKLFNNEVVHGSEIRTFAKNGEVRRERVFAHPIWSPEENRLVGILGAVQDITEQKEAQEKLQKIFLQQEAILNNIPDMAWLKDTESRYIAVNEQFLRICGLNYEDIIGKTDVEIWDAAYAENYQADDLEVIQSGIRKTVEETQKDSSGREYWVETTKTPIRDEHGKVIGTTGIARNISERKMAEMERERLIIELGAKNAELERFTYTVSHDLKSPLVTITGFLGYLERDARAGKLDNFKSDMDRIQQAVDKMQILLNDLLELSRIGRIIHEPVEEEFGAIVRDALSLLNGSIIAGNIHVDFVDEGCKIIGDRVRLLEVLQNLMENAIKFMGDQPTPEIRIGSIKDNEGKPVFFVQDNGIGIEPQYQDRVFGIFNKLDAKTEGSGIGLTLVKRIIEVHNGKIWLNSQPGKGTTFFFTIPGANTKE